MNSCAGADGKACRPGTAVASGTGSPTCPWQRTGGPSTSREPLQPPASSEPAPPLPTPTPPAQDLFQRGTGPAGKLEREDGDLSPLPGDPRGWLHEQVRGLYQARLHPGCHPGHGLGEVRGTILCLVRLGAGGPPDPAPCARCRATWTSASSRLELRRRMRFGPLSCCCSSTPRGSGGPSGCSPPSGTASSSRACRC